MFALLLGSMGDGSLKESDGTDIISRVSGVAIYVAANFG